MKDKVLGHLTGICVVVIFSYYTFGFVLNMVLGIGAYFGYQNPNDYNGNNGKYKNCVVLDDNKNIIHSCILPVEMEHPSNCTNIVYVMENGKKVVGTYYWEEARKALL